MISKYKNNFDIVRLFLAVLVFFGHWNILTQQNIHNVLFHLETYAVDLFFIVSGFLIYWSYENDQNNNFFYLKRFFRIFPLYLILIALQTLFFLIYTESTNLELVKYFFSNIIFLNFLSPTVGDIFINLEVNAINGSLWTLKNEIFFYLLVPFIFKIYEKLGLRFLLFLYVCSVTYLFVVEYFNLTKMLVQFPGQLRLFIAGIILYILFDYISEIKRKSYYMLVLVSFVSLIYFNNILFKYILYPLMLSIILFFIVYKLNKIKIKFDFSYSFYILHFPIIQLFLYFNINPENSILSFFTLFLTIIVLSYLSEIFIEKKFVKIGRELIRKMKIN